MKFDKHGIAITMKDKSNTSLLGYIGAFIGVAVGLSIATKVIEKVKIKQDEI